MKKGKPVESSNGILKSFWPQLLLVLLCFLFYGNTLNNGFSLDDDFVTSNNQMVKGGISALPEIFTSPYATEGKYVYEYRPLVKATFALEHQFFKGDPLISHFINVLIYSITAVLLFNFLRSILKNYSVSFILFVVSLFVIHPSHTEVVASLKNRDGLLSLLFLVASLHTGINYYRSGKVSGLITSVLLFLLGLISKSDIIIIGALLPLTGYFFTDANWKRLFAPLLILVLVFAAFTYLKQTGLESANREMNYYENPLFFEKSLWARITAALVSMGFYLKLMFFPYPLLSYYGFNKIDVLSFPQVSQLFAAGALILLFYFGKKRFQKKELWLFGAAWFLISISLFLNLILPAVGIVAERFAYIASFGFCLMLVDLFWKFVLKTREQANPQFSGKLILPFVLVVVCYYQVTARNQDWKCFYTLLSHDIRYLENSAKANDLYALACSQEALAESNPGRKNVLLDESLKGYRKATEVYPGYVSAYNNLGSVYVNLHSNHKTAIPLFEKALSLKPDYKQAMANLAFCYQKDGKVDKAVQMYEAIISDTTAKYLNAFFNLGEIYFKQDRFQEAVDLNLKAAKLFPKADLPWVTIGNYYLLKGDTSSAVNHWETAIRIYPENDNLNRNLSAYFKSKGEDSKAKYYRSLIRNTEKY